MRAMPLSRQYLDSSLESLFMRAHAEPARSGVPRLEYRDAYDHFALRLERTNAGYSIGCFVNGSPSYQLNGLFFAKGTQIGEVLLIAAGAPNGSTIDSFFVDGASS